MSDSIETGDAAPKQNIRRPAAKNKGGRPRKVNLEPELASGASRLRRAGRPDSARIQRAVPREEPREETRGPDTGKRLFRNRRRTEDIFLIDKNIVPQGMSYEWKRVAVKGKPESSHQVNLRENGWTPVPSSRHPELMPDDHRGPIQKDEMMLMERPKYLTDEARLEDYEIARDQVRIKEASLRDTPPNTFTRDHPSARANTGIRKSYEPMSIPD